MRASISICDPLRRSSSSRAANNDLRIRRKEIGSLPPNSLVSNSSAWANVSFLGSVAIRARSKNGAIAALLPSASISPTVGIDACIHARRIVEAVAPPDLTMIAISE